MRYLSPDAFLRFLLYAIPFTPLIFAHGMFFPFIAGKMLAFQGLVFAATLLWLYCWSRNPARYNPSISWLAIAIAAYILVSFIAALQGVNFWRSFWGNFERMDGIFTWITLLLFLIMLGVVLKRKEEWIWLFRLSLFVSIISGLQSVQFFHIFEGTFLVPTRMAGEFGSPIYVGVYAMFHVFIALFLIYTLNIDYKRTRDLRVLLKNKWALLYAIGLLTNLLILFLTYARGPIIGFLVGILLIAIFYGLCGSNRKLLIKVSGALLLLLLITSPFWGTSSLAKRIYSVTAGLGADETRTINWVIAWNAFQERPVLGWGSNNYPIAQNQFYNPHLAALTPEPFDKTHNKYLELAIDAGATGLVSYLAIFGIVFVQLLRERRKNPFLAALFLGTLTAYGIQNISAFDNPGSYLPLFLFFGLINQEFFTPRFSIGPNPAFMVTSTLLVLAFLWQGVWQPYQANRTLAKTLSLQDHTQKDYGAILAGYKKALSYQTLGDYEIRMRLGVFASNTPELTQELLLFTISELEKELVMSPQDVRVHLLLAKSYERKALAEKDEKTANQAEEHFVKAMEISPKRTDTIKHYVVFLINRGNIEKARSEISKIKEIDEDIFNSHEVQWYIGMTHYVKKDFAKAYEQFQTIITRGGGFSDEYELLVLADTASKLEKTEEMVAWYEKLVNTYKDNAEYRIYLALAYREAGEKELARNEARNALIIDPRLEDQVNEFLASLE